MRERFGRAVRFRSAQRGDARGPGRRARQDAVRGSSRYRFRRSRPSGTRKDPLTKGADGHVAWDLNAYDFLKDRPAPDTVNPSLWRHSQVLNRNSLFKDTDRIYQVRGFDVSNITFIQGDTGWVVIDTQTGVETARAAYDLVTQALSKRPITAIL